MVQIEYLSAERIKELKTELEKLKTKDMYEIASRVEHARSLGDLKENAEYHRAKDDQNWLFSRITDLENILKRAQLVEKNSSGKISMGSLVELTKSGGSEKILYTMVSQSEANLGLGKLSVDSPLGMALLGHKTGESVYVETSRGEVVYKIISVI